MVDNAAGENDVVAVKCTLVEPYGSASLGGAYIAKLILVSAYMVNNADSVIDFLRDKTNMLFLGLTAVGAGGGNDKNILVADAGAFKFFY